MTDEEYFEVKVVSDANLEKMIGNYFDGKNKTSTDGTKTDKKTDNSAVATLRLLADDKKTASSEYTAKRLELYTKILGDEALAKRWLSDKWMEEGLNKEAMKFLSPVILTPEEKVKKKLLAKNEPVYRLYF